MKNCNKYIFITGGVVSSLGKGITSASIGLLLKEIGLKVNMLKFDPYLNVDPGTMSPYQHGEVFVTKDGAEADLDLGHYERFLDKDMEKKNNVTSGQIYETVINRERKGGYLGGTVQVIPHITDEIKRRIKEISNDNDVAIIEVGGTVGDIESLPFLEAIRQFQQDVGKQNVIYIHLTLLPYIRAAEELKTKPTQHSVGKLREIGIQPDIIICRTERVLPEEIKRKIALFCNVSKESVIEERDVGNNIYEVPICLKEEGLDAIILKHLGLRHKSSDLKLWKRMASRIRLFKSSVVIGIAGKYTELKDAYKSICEALSHSGVANGVIVDIRYIDVDVSDVKKRLAQVDGILVPGGFGERGIEGKIRATRYAREKGIPFLGICLGMQCAVIDFARNVCGMRNANSTEFDAKTDFPVVDLLQEQRNIKDKGATMRLGDYRCRIKPGSNAFRAYAKTGCSGKKVGASRGYIKTDERHRHRYEINSKFVRVFNQNGLVISGVEDRQGLIEIIEIGEHPWFVAVQFHPEFRSRPLRPHPLFSEFIKKACNEKNKRD